MRGFWQRKITIAGHIAFLAIGHIVEQAPTAGFFTNPQPPAARRFLERVLQ